MTTHRHGAFYSSHWPWTDVDAMTFAATAVARLRDSSSDPGRGTPPKHLRMETGAIAAMDAHYNYYY